MNKEITIQDAQKRDEILLITAEQKQITFLRNSLLEIKPLENSTCELSIREDLESVSRFVINENADILKKKLYI